MRRFFLNIIFCLFSTAAFAQATSLPANSFMASPSGGSGFLSPRLMTGTDLPLFTPGGTGAVPEAILSWMLRLPTTPQDFGAKCDGSTDDHVALAAWIAALGATQAGYIPPGTCVTTVELNLGSAAGLVINGAGPYTSVIKYTGAGTTGDVVYGGSSGGTVQGWILRNFRITSSTTMTANFCLHLQNLSFAIVENVTIDGHFGSHNCFGGEWFDGFSEVLVSGMDNSAYGATADGIRASGTAVSANVSLHLERGNVDGPVAIQLHIAGGADVITGPMANFQNAVQNLKIDESIYATNNTGIFFLPGTYFDASTSTTLPDCEIADTGGNQLNPHIEFDSGWCASSAANGVQIDSGFVGTFIWTGGFIGNHQKDCVTINSTTGIIQFDSPNISYCGLGGSGGIGIDAAVTNVNISNVGVRFSNNAHGNTNYSPSAIVGLVGEPIQGTGTVASVSSGTPTTIASFTLTPGAWNCNVNFLTQPAGTTTSGAFSGSLSGTTNTIPANALWGGFSVPYATAAAGVPLQENTGRMVLQPATTTTYYAVASITFAVSTMGVTSVYYCTRAQ
jgi:hypothetical protein